MGLGIVVLAFALMRPGARTGPSNGPPRAEIEPRSARIVAPEDSDKVVSTFSVRNTGGASLTLGKATTTCGCTVASISHDLLQPGETATILVEATPMSVGERHVEVRIESNAFPDPILRLPVTVVGSGKPPYVASAPESLHFGIFRSEESAGKEVEFSVSTREFAGPYWIDAITINHPSISIRRKTIDEFDTGVNTVYRTYRYTARIDEPLPVGEWSDELRIRSREQPEILHRLAIHATIRPEVHVTPRSLFGSYASTDPLPTFHVFVTASAGDHPFDVTLVSCPAGIAVERSAGASESRVGFTVKVLELPGDELNDKIVFATTHPDAPEIVLPLLVRRPRL